MMNNYTDYFIQLVDRVIEKNKSYVINLEIAKNNNLMDFYKIISNRYGTSFKSNSIIKNFIIDNIKKELQIEDVSLSMSTDIFYKIKDQIKIYYLDSYFSKEKANFYYFFVNALIDYGIIRRLDNIYIIKLIQNNIWEEIILKLYELYIVEDCKFSMNICDFSNYDRLPRLIESKKEIEQRLKEKIEIIDAKVIFKREQEKRIVKKIEKKLSQLNLFDFLNCIFYQYQSDKKRNAIEQTIPYKYIINVLVKNISKSKHKRIDDNKINSVIKLCNSFICLYQLEEDKFKKFFLLPNEIEDYLHKQILQMNFYPIYQFKRNVLVDYINNLIIPNVDKTLFRKKFEFDIDDLVKFFNLLFLEKDSILKFDKKRISSINLKILDFFSIDVKNVNQEYEL